MRIKSLNSIRLKNMQNQII